MLAILSSAREAAFYVALVRGTAVCRDPRRSHRDADVRLARLQVGFGVFWAGGDQRPSDTSSVVGLGGSWSGTVGDTEEMMILVELSSDLGPASSGGAGTRKKKKRPQKTESVGARLGSTPACKPLLLPSIKLSRSYVAPFAITRDIPNWSWVSTMSTNIATETPTQRKDSVAPPLPALQFLPETS